MIVVGILAPSRPAHGAVIEIARRAASSGARTEVAGAVPPGPEGDRLLLELAAAGVGHATVTRTAADPDAADTELALRYLPEVRAIVVVGPEPALATVAAAAAWAGATLVVVDDSEPPETLPVTPVVLAPPALDEDGTFAGFVAALAVRLDRGLDPRAAWDETIATLSADPVGRQRRRG